MYKMKLKGIRLTLDQDSVKKLSIHWQGFYGKKTGTRGLKSLCGP